MLQITGVYGDGDGNDKTICGPQHTSGKRNDDVRSKGQRNCFGFSKGEEETLPEFVAEPTTAFSVTTIKISCTHEYLAPELISGDGHGNGVDRWAFGVLVYELLYETTPFRGRSKECTLRNIGTKTVRFDEVDVKGMAQAKDLIEKLLVKDPRERLGCARGDEDEDRENDFFQI
ncbi:serine/threonine-protein kinase WAG1-like [Helianthus annuus]|uniref:serine/threonine-protein kinase WAG1-like n=1 Tax=Helianthus annuus TaxID=4232 RepID=UPI000B90520E|nr:serine/threonine-protein kinase WAG1-like [Helianthus annuus]